MNTQGMFIQRPHLGYFLFSLFYDGRRPAPRHDPEETRIIIVSQLFGNSSLRSVQHLKRNRKSKHVES